ncbi:MAG: prepilin-type N-terminal cleavage/methylation domain-containing protein [Patescibacteria group bacterium]|jgi:prepilin-type N-terminal cleavage/methylation domain-containing protein
MMRKNSAGFTLIEILIAIAIFSILSSIMILNFRGDAKTKELKNDCQKITDALRQAQTMALSGQQVTNGSGKSFIPDAYRFMPTCSGFPATCKSFSLIASSSPSFMMSKTRLDKSEIYGLNSLVINFIPPSADSSISVNGVATTSVNIKVRHTQNNTLSRCVSYNSISGRIDILDISKCN